MTGQPLRLHLVDDDYLVQLGMERLFEKLPDVILESVRSTGNEAIGQAVALRPDVVLIETRVRNVEGLRAIREITARVPGARVAVLSSPTTFDAMSEAYHAGAVSYLFKDSISSDLGAAVRMIHRGESIFSMPPDLDRFPLPVRSKTTFEIDQIRRLSTRDRDILAGLTAGRTNAQIGASLHISEATVKAQITKIMARVNVCGRVQLAVLAVKAGVEAA